MQNQDNVNKLIDIIRHLRSPEGCPWDRKQTHKSLKPMMIEEASELLDAIDNKDVENIREELGDLLMHIVFHSLIAEENGEFNFDDVAKEVSEKMLRRHPHIFGDRDKPETADEVVLLWKDIKAQEKKHKKNKSILDGIPNNLPALTRAEKIQIKAAEVGFDWRNINEIFDKLEEELAELRQAFDNNNDEEIEDELGEYSRVEQSFEDIEKVWKYNKEGIFAVLEFCRKHGSKIIYSGSSTKFGDGGLGRNQSPYAWTKASNTELVVNYGNWFNVPYAITYFYNVYGKREISSGKYATLIAMFAEKMKRGETLTVVSPGTQKRNFTNVEDIINGLVMVGENGYGDDFGIGSPDAYTILEIAEMFGGKIEMLPERKGNRMCADVVSAKTEALGWEARHCIKEYINKLKSNNWRNI